MNAHEKRVEELLRARQSAAPSLPEPVFGAKFFFAVDKDAEEDAAPPSPQMRPMPPPRPVDCFDGVQPVYIKPE